MLDPSLAAPLASPRRPVVNRIAVADLTAALRGGLDDFSSKPSHVIFLIVIYPAIGLLIARFTTADALMPLFFPLVAGFALVGPFAALGLYEFSRRRELGLDPTWTGALDALRKRPMAPILELGVVLMAILVAWLFSAKLIADGTIGDVKAETFSTFLRTVLATPSGWTMIVVGDLVGFCFAALAFSISVVSFPMMLDRDVDLVTAVGASLEAVRRNPGPMAVWGLVVAVALAAGSLPFFIGLAVVLPILGHATWHLYRRLVAR